MYASVNTAKRPPTLIVLCILSIIGSVFFILKGMISYFMLAASNDERSVGTIQFIDTVYWLEWLSCIGTMIGAIIMLVGKRIGFIIYAISSIFYILLTIVFAVFCFLSIIGILIGVLQFFYLIPSILFLVLYTIQLRHLKD